MIKALFILGLWHTVIMDHDVHVSVCDINVDKSEIQITLKTFIDDLQLAIGLSPGDEVPEDYTSAEDLIEQYIRSTIVLSAEGTNVILEVDDISASNDAVWITVLASVHPTDIQKMTVTSSFLTEVYNDQTNIININHNKDKETFSLNRNKKNITYELEE